MSHHYLGNEPPPSRYSRNNLTYSPINAGSIDGRGEEFHDRALSRGLQSHYNPLKDQKISGDPYLTLFIARLHPKTTEDTLIRFFGSFGPITRLRLVRDIVTGESKRYAFVSFESDRSFLLCWKRAHKSMLDGAQILVEFERERITKHWVPRRHGGGIGGRKESGQLRFGGRDRPYKLLWKYNRLESPKPHTRSFKPRREKYTPKNKQKEPLMGVVVNLDDEETGNLCTLYFKPNIQSPQNVETIDITDQHILIP